MRIAIEIDEARYKDIQRIAEVELELNHFQTAEQIIAKGVPIEQEPCEDAISRQAAIEAVKKNTFRLTFAEEQNYEGHVAWSANAVYSDVIEGALLELPSAQPEQQWVPCSERLPEEDTEVLISYRYKEGEGDTDHVNIDITSYGTTCFGGREIHTLKEWRQPFDYFHANYEVIAWMPLPEPYKGGEQDE